MSEQIFSFAHYILFLASQADPPVYLANKNINGIILYLINYRDTKNQLDVLVNIRVITVLAVQYAVIFAFLFYKQILKMFRIFHHTN